MLVFLEDVAALLREFIGAAGEATPASRRARAKEEAMWIGYA